MSDKWNTRFMQLAQLVATWSKDPSTKVGAVVVNSKKRVVSVGFNGFPAGTDDTEGSRGRKLLRTVHAEVNAVSFAVRSVEDCSLYSTHPPCAHCAGILIQHGIKEVYFPQVSNEFMLRWRESFDEAITMFSEAGVYFEELNSESISYKCPWCGGTNIRDSVEWIASSMEEQNNTSVLVEKQCTDCEGRSFWL